jgi:hypothetical protein
VSFAKVGALMLPYRRYLQGISFYSGKALAPYKIIYFLLGGMAIVVGLLVVFFMPDSPIHAPLLTKEERIAALERVREDQVGVENKVLKREQVLSSTAMLILGGSAPYFYTGRLSKL